jgi:type I restriction enzyme M protein
MVDISPWLNNRYETLWKKFQVNEFRTEDINKVFSEKDLENIKGVAMLVSELKKVGLLNFRLDPKDSRKRIFKLKAKEDLIKEGFNKIRTNDNLNIEQFKKGSVIKKLTRSDIESILKKAADLIRTRVDYKFILILLFYKRISDKWKLEFDKAYNEAIEDGLSEEEAKKEAKSEAYHDFVIPEDCLWEKIRTDTKNLPENFSKALKSLGESNQELKDIIDNMDFIQFTNNRENSEILRQLVELFSEKELHDVAPDILGDAYEWILGYFAPDKAKEGEVYTPREVIKLIVEILDPKPHESVYDPACASAGMLIISFKHVEEKYGRKEAEKMFLYGQEANHKTLAFGKMNLYIHDIRNANLAFGDTILYPKFKEKDKVMKFTHVIVNPPWNKD